MIIQCRRELGGKKTPIWINEKFVEFIDKETVTVGLVSGKVIDTDEQSCDELTARLIRDGKNKV